MRRYGIIPIFGIIWAFKFVKNGRRKLHRYQPLLDKFKSFYSIYKPIFIFYFIYHIYFIISCLNFVIYIMNLSKFRLNQSLAFAQSVG